VRGRRGHDHGRIDAIEGGVHGVHGLGPGVLCDIAGATGIGVVYAQLGHVLEAAKRRRMRRAQPAYAKQTHAHRPYLR